MTSQRLTTDRLELRPLAAEAATALTRDRLLASQMLGATLRTRRGTTRAHSAVIELSLPLTA